MRVSAEFTDGSTTDFDVSGGGFSPSQDEKFLFVYPDGVQREGRILSVESAEERSVDAIFDHESRLIHVTE